MPAKTKQRVGDLYETITRAGFTIYDRMRAEELPNLSALIEAEDPTPLRDRVLGIDGYARMLAHADIRTRGDRFGAFSADRMDRFYEGANRVLFPELMRRMWRQGSIDRKNSTSELQDILFAAQDSDEETERALGERALAHYFSTDFVKGTVQRPWIDSNDPTLPVIEPAIPLAEIVSRSRGLDDTQYRRRQISAPAAADIRLLRVTEAAELPKAKITEASRTVQLYKFGRALEASYEAIRRLPIDDFALHVRMLRLQTEVDQVAAALDVAIYGDGNGGSAATVYNLTALDSTTTANNLTVAAWLAFKLLWANPYQLTTVLAQQAPLLKLLTLNVGTANILLATNPVPGVIGQPFTPINTRLTDGVRFGLTSDAPANQIVGFDNRFAIEHLTENGSDISEAERYITRQTEVLTFSMNEGFAIFDTGSVKILNLAA